MLLWILLAFVVLVVAVLVVLVMGIEEYCSKVIKPVSTELAARVIAKFPDMVEYGLEVRHA